MCPSCLVSEKLNLLLVMRMMLMGRSWSICSRWRWRYGRMKLSLRLKEEGRTSGVGLQWCKAGLKDECAAC